MIIIPVPAVTAGAVSRDTWTAHRMLAAEPPATIIRPAFLMMTRVHLAGRTFSGYMRTGPDFSYLVARLDGET